MPNTSLTPDAVFVDTGVPRQTYVSVNGGELEAQLAKVVRWHQNAHVAGPSKTGKSVLIARVLGEMNQSSIKVPCTGKQEPKDVWAAGLERLAFERIANRSDGSKGSVAVDVETPSGPFGILANWIGRAKLGLSASSNEEVARERVLAEPSAHHLVEALKHDGSVFVLENIHLLQPTALDAVCHGIREFDAERLTAILVSARPRVTRAAIREADLAGRTADVDVSTWNLNDLQEIVRRGFEALKLNIAEETSAYIAHWSAGLPIVAQQCCRELLSVDPTKSPVGKTPRNFGTRNQTRSPWSARDVADAMHSVCNRYYRYFHEDFERLAGPRPRKAALSVREATLRAFEAFPLLAALTMSELRSRIAEFKTDMPATEERILAAVQSLVEEDMAGIGEPLFEWSERDYSLRIVDPSFHFYIAWGRSRRNDEIMPPA